MWFIGVEVEQETSAPPPKKNPRSAPDLGSPLGCPLNRGFTLLSSINKLNSFNLPFICSINYRKKCGSEWCSTVGGYLG